MTRAILAPLVVVLLLCGSALVVSSAQDEAIVQAPMLTEIQRLQLTNLSQQIEIAQLKAQAAQKDFDSAREQLLKMVMAVQVKGWTFDLASLTYRKDPDAK